MPIYGYARVSTCGQELDRREQLLTASGCNKIFSEKESGTNDERRALWRLLGVLRPGDTVVVDALDRLTRGGPFKTLSALQDITSRGATYKSLAEPWADTTTELGEVLAALYIARKTREDMSSEDWKARLSPLEAIDWSKKNPEWENVCIVANSVVSNRQARAATKAFIKAKLGVQLTDGEQRSCATLKEQDNGNFYYPRRAP